MKRRTQVYIDELQYEEAKILMEETGKSLSELIREGLDRVLKKDYFRTRKEKNLEGFGLIRDNGGVTDYNHNEIYE